MKKYELFLNETTFFGTMDWTKFDRKIRLEASAESIYNAWMNIDEIQKWFLRKIIVLNMENEKVLTQGDKIIWNWHNTDFPQEVEILKNEPFEQLAFTFGHEMEVHITIKKEGQFNVVHLQQRNIPTGDKSKYNFYAGCMRGWTFWLANLKAFLDHGICLHDTSLGPRDDLFDFSNT